ncbi:hypothetical protein quinque_001380 [Culex quinquefasciatus]
MTAQDDPDTLNYEMTFEFIKAPITCKDERRKDAVTETGKLSAGVVKKYLYVRLGGLLLPKNNQGVTLEYNTSLSTVTSIRFATKARIVIRNSEGVSETACPLSDDTGHRHVVEVFSNGLTRKNPHIRFEPSKVISVEFYSRTTARIPLTGAKKYPIQFPDLNGCVNEFIWCDGIA